MAGRVAIVEHMAETPLGLVGQALDEAGVEQVLFRPYLDGALPEPEGFDGLVVLGGEQNARADADWPYLAPLCDRMRAFDAAGKPVLGICLGSQLLARAWGGKNRIGGHREFGWCEIVSLGGDPLVEGMDVFPAFQWHSDHFTLPPGAVRLAAGGQPNQMFRVGNCSYGSQFHFEMSRAVVRGFTETHPDAMETMSPGWLAQHAEEEARFGLAADAAGLALARRWVALLC